MKYEKEWYQFIEKYRKNETIDFIANIFHITDKSILMEYKKDYIPVYKYLSRNNIDDTIRNKVLSIIINKINQLHSIEKYKVSKEIFIEDLLMEINEKVYNRKKILKYFIEYFGNIKKVNGIEIDSFENVIKKCNNIIIQYYQQKFENKNKNGYEYSILFGDCQFSNILINPNHIEEIVFIDPRGYFGYSKIFGPVEYDYAKVLYGISGYDTFNNEYFNIEKIGDSEITFQIKAFDFSKEIMDENFKKIHQAFLVIIWLSLAEYTKNNIWKCIGSYYYGLYLGTQL
jgi:hypothetical protein